MSAAILHPTGLRPTHQPGSLRAAALALGAHGLLIAALALGLNWRISPPENVVAAEIWAAVPQVAAPAPVEPPTPKVEPPPTVPKPVPAPPPKPVEATPPPRDAQIAIEKAKREKKAALEREAELKQAEKLKAERLQAEKLKADKERAEKEKEREKAERLKKEQQAQREKADEERMAKQRDANLARIRGLAGAEGAPTDTGTAQRNAATSSAYPGRIKARIKPNIVLMSEVSGNPITEVEVRCSPDGLIISRRIVKPSGDKTWDDTVLRAIDRTEMLPRDVDGRVPATMTLVFPRRE